MIHRLLARLSGIPQEQHPQYIACLILALEQHEFGEQWLSSRRPDRAAATQGPPLAPTLALAGIRLNPRQQTRLQGCQTLPDLLCHFHLKGVPLDCQEGLLGWIEGRYPLDLRLDIPSAREMLDHQCRGRRFVSFRAEPGLLFQRIGRHAGTLAFALHDFEHAHKFFANPTLTRGQIRFFRHLRAALEGGLFSSLTHDAQFSTELEYLMADMNSHPLHLWKYLKAIIMNAHLRRGHSNHREFIEKLVGFWNWSDDLRESAKRINFPGFEEEADRLRVSDYFLAPPSENESTHVFPN
jgi:hypothetical protein